MSELGEGIKEVEKPIEPDDGLPLPFSPGTPLFLEKPELRQKGNETNKERWERISNSADWIPKGRVVLRVSTSDIEARKAMYYAQVIHVEDEDLETLAKDGETPLKPEQHVHILRKSYKKALVEEKVRRLNAR